MVSVLPIFFFFLLYSKKNLNTEICASYFDFIFQSVFYSSHSSIVVFDPFPYHPKIIVMIFPCFEWYDKLQFKPWMVFIDMKSLNPYLLIMAWYMTVAYSYFCFMSS